MVSLSKNNAVVNQIRYEFEQRPKPGEVLEVLPGIKWLRMPLPMMLGSINLWLLRDNDGWTVVDTGLGTEATQNVWEQVIVDHLENKPVKQVIVTHLHPDHAGMAGWLCEKYDAPLSMTRTEYLTCRVLAADRGPAPLAGTRFYQAAGYNHEQLERYKKRFGQFGSVIRELPPGFSRLQNGDELDIGDTQWRIIEGNGHSPEHACLFSESRNLIISGDQILPTISSNVSVWPTEPHADPLDLWLASCHNLSKRLPEDVLVLPAHGKPFRGAAFRLAQIIDEHETGLHKLRELCKEPKRALDVFPALFKATINDNNLIMATGEALAHLRYLQARGELGVSRDVDGVDWYEKL